MSTQNIANKKYYLLASFLLVLGFSVRIVGIAYMPSGLNQDEASIGYEAYSIMETGLDRTGHSYPVHLESWGSGQNALYAYLTIPFLRLFGLNAFSVRIVNAIFSCISLLLFFLLFRMQYNRKVALAALALFAVFPWSIMSARWGLESNILPTIFLAAVFFLTKGIVSNQKYFLLSFLLFALSLYSYGVTYLVLPLFFLLIIPYLVLNKKIRVNYLLLSLTVFFVVALPIILFVLINHLNLQTIQFWGITIPRLDANRTTVVFNLFHDNFILTLGKNIVRFLSVLVLQTDGSDYNAIPMFGTIYPISFLFLIVGISGVLKNRNFKDNSLNYMFLSWILCSVILGISSHANINRINIIFIPLLYFTVLGIFDVKEMLQPEFRNRYKNVLVGFYSFFFVMFCGYYVFIFNEIVKKDFSYGLRDAILFAEENTNKKDSVNITTQTINMPYIYVCFYNKLNPDEFGKSVKYDEKTQNTGFRGVKQLGRYTFGTNMSALHSIHILSQTEFEMTNYPTKFSKNFGNYYVVRFNDK
ncbi:MAG: glycosyltransferase family 39 protein [Paludibacter sp.]|nr:glycosyltransferase family 39 protein [Paludibacter sp.]